MIQLGVALGQHDCAVTETRDELFKRRRLRLEVRLLKKELLAAAAANKKASLTLHPCGVLPPGHCWAISVNSGGTGLICSDPAMGDREWLRVRHDLVQRMRPFTAEVTRT